MLRKYISVIVIGLMMIGCKSNSKTDGASSDSSSPHASTQWTTLFDGISLDGWTVPRAGNEGEVSVKDGAIDMKAGENGTFIRLAGKPPTDNYEVAFEAMRVEGGDFFGTLTFPVGKGYCSFVLGGWMNTTSGLSSVDGLDASMNLTSFAEMYDNKKWYKVRIRVNSHAVQCWVNGERKVCQFRKLDDGIQKRDYEFDTRPELDDCKPMGFATWWTHGAVRNIRIRNLTPEEAAEKPEEMGMGF